MIEVYDGHAHWTCRIEQRERRGKSQFRYVLERRFVETEDWQNGRWTSDRDKAVRRGKKLLESKQVYKYDSEQL